MNSLYLQSDEIERIFKNHITCNENTMSLKTLFGERMTRKINYQPYYQRNYVWDNNKASFFIESILLGTDIPPLILFNSGDSIEVIDGRQRYETIKKFRNGEFRLNIKGLTKLTKLKNYTFSKLDPDTQRLFDDAKIRFFEFEVFNEPKLDSLLEDKIKKEIFRRYNSGITPLNSAEIDNASYDDDDITNTLKKMVLYDDDLVSGIKERFLGRVSNNDSAKILQFLRKYLVLSSFPIKTFATGSSRTEILDLLYNVKSENTENPDEICMVLIENLKTTLKLIEKIGIVNNRRINEGLLWAIFILKEDGINIESLFSNSSINFIRKFLQDNIHKFYEEGSHLYKPIIERHYAISEMFNELIGFDFSLYIKNEDFKNEIKDLRQSDKEAKLKLEELATLRVQKPGASIIPVEEIISELNSNNYLLRPSYQRQEKINEKKASAIIESIILGIRLPPLFICINENGIKEIIDGQQRLLSILGFVGKTYKNELGKQVYPNLVNFKLRNLKILKDYNNKRYSELDFNVQDKIQGFNLSVIEIDKTLNKSFEPVDLFIRLNNKPYPIRDNSFEMWNSFMDKDVMDKVKEVTKEHREWFFIQKINSEKGLDRMLNEELITLLSYILYNKTYRKDYTSIGFYLRDSKVTCRITDKDDVTKILEKISIDVLLKNQFLNSINSINSIIDEIKLKLNSVNFIESLNTLFQRESNKRYLVDFYLLISITQRLSQDRLSAISFNELQDKMQVLKDELNNPHKLNDGLTQHDYFESLLDKISI